ncbi:fimbrial biogenesis outer membrane usher protein [Buttiauxella sp. B2]|uniref:fimbria/pilus outer membrane usher protein n=1 Tax=Buttiauxella sp. B2 TaxID=2587812 RepID=UPI0011228419|nr:fimbria/pilus outer membrane usher protein [Buttiauxella sp. B2]TNV20451.1 fimbrial biogenesis outer membrane usher protein [Buttiauxella sp. B2]
MDFNKKTSVTPFLVLAHISLLPMSVYAEDDTRYTFNNAILMGNAQGNDLSSFDVKSLPPGSYSVDIYVNDYWRGRHEILLSKDKSGDLATCHSAYFLDSIGINSIRMNKTFAEDKNYCGTINKWDVYGNAVETFNAGQLELRMSVPQAYLDNTDSNYVQPEQWQKGIPAINLGYMGDYYSMQQRGDNRTSSDSAWLGLDIRASASGWLLEHFGSLDWNNDSGKHYSSNRTTLKKPLIGWKSMLSAGQFYTDNKLFDGLSILGASLESHDQMHPDNTLSWAPNIRGIAETNARVTVTQDGRIIHQTSVPAGPFSIESILPANTGADLLVTIQESDGRIRRFSVPYSSVPQLLKPGVSRYNLSAGKIDEQDSDDAPFAAQATWQYGLNNYVSLYSGATGFDHYQAVLIGSGLNTFFGAFALDITQSRFNFDAQENHGQGYRLTYNRTIPFSQTSLWLEGKFNTQHYYGQRDAFEQQDNGTEYKVLREKQSYSLNLSQPLLEEWGALNVSGSINKYWGKQDSYRQYSVGYSNSWGNLNWTLSVQRLWNEDEIGKVMKDDQIALNFNYYLPRSDSGYTQIYSDSYSSNGKASNTRIGFSTSMDEENNTTLGMNAGYGRGGEMDWGMNGSYRSPYSTLSTTLSQGNDWHQASAGLSGSLIAHRRGVTFSPERSDTVALVYAEDAQGARLEGAPGTRFDSNGYAVMPWLRAWRVNEVVINPKGADGALNFQQTQRKVVPFEGNVVHVAFETKINKQTIIHPKLLKQKTLPFGAMIKDQENNHIGYVGQGGLLYIDQTQSPTVSISSEKETCIVDIESQEVTCR